MGLGWDGTTAKERLYTWPLSALQPNYHCPKKTPARLCAAVAASTSSSVTVTRRFKRMNQAVDRYGGTVSRLMGDAVLAIEQLRRAVEPMRVNPAA